MDSDVEGVELAVPKIRCHVKDDRIMVDDDVLADMLDEAGLQSDDDVHEEPPRKKYRCRQKGPACLLHQGPGERGLRRRPGGRRAAWPPCYSSICREDGG